VLVAASGIVALIYPEATFAGFADILGFVFLMIGILWTVQAFAERIFNDLWRASMGRSRTVVRVGCSSYRRRWW
jgi:uncharacterized membrane protein HdeD (DUF308 family)